MRFLLLTLVLAVSVGPLLSAEEPLIDPTDAPIYVRQGVTVSGLEVAVFASKRGNAFINFGDKYPNQTFMGWIPAGTPLAIDPSLKLLDGKPVKIAGVIEIYRGKLLRTIEELLKRTSPGREKIEGLGSGRTGW